MPPQEAPARDPVAEMNALATPTGYDAEKFRPQSTTLLGIDTLCPSPCNPRKHFDGPAMDELIASVRQHGVLEPILVRPWPGDYAHNPSPLPMWEIVGGERRWRAARAAGMTLIEAKVRHLSDKEMLEIMIVENLQREGLTPLEEADGYARMHDEYGYSAEQIADKIGKSKSYVFGRMKLTALCHVARKAVTSGKLPASHALLIARLPTTALQEQATLEISNGHHSGEPMSYRMAAQHVQSKYMLELTKAPFAPNDFDLVPAAGTCKLCPKRTGNATDLFDEVKNANLCTDPACYAGKVKAHKDRQIKDAKAEGIKVITGKAAEEILPHGAEYGARSGGVVALDEKSIYHDGKYRSYRELVGKDVVPTAMVEDKRSGALVPVVEKKQIAEALKAAGITQGKDLASTQQKENEKKAKLETEYRRRLHGAVREAIRTDLFEDESPSLEADELVMVARAFCRRTDHEATKRIVGLWAPIPEGQKAPEWNDRIAAFQEAGIRDLTTAELYLLLIDLAVVGETHVNSYCLDSKPERLLELAKHSQIDAAAIRKGVQAEAKAKEKGKAKAGKEAAPSGTKPPKPETTAPAADDVKIGDAVRIKAGATWADGKPIKSAGKTGTVMIAGAYLTVRVGSGRCDTVTGLVRSHLERIDPEPPAETISTPESAARAAEDVPTKPAKTKAAAKKTKAKDDPAPASPANEPAAPVKAAGEGLDPRAAWPFPVRRST